MVSWFAYQYECLSVCLTLRALISSGVIWCDIDHVGKQVLQLFLALMQLLYMIYLPSVKWMGVSLFTLHVINACQRRLS